jgi:hypothetical protein
MTESSIPKPYSGPDVGRKLWSRSSGPEPSNFQDDLERDGIDRRRGNPIQFGLDEGEIEVEGERIENLLKNVNSGRQPSGDAASVFHVLDAGYLRSAFAAPPFTARVSSSTSRNAR